MNLAACLSMKEEHKLTRFKSLKVALKELEPFVKNGQHLRTGRNLSSSSATCVRGKCSRTGFSVQPSMQLKVVHGIWLFGVTERS